LGVPLVLFAVKPVEALVCRGQPRATLKVGGQLADSLLSAAQKIGVFRHLGCVATRAQGHFVSLGVRQAVTQGGQSAEHHRYRQRDNYEGGQSA
jgi:hypothetical protein